MDTTLEGIHQLVHLLLNIVSVLNTILLAVDALFGSASVAHRLKMQGKRPLPE
jgi:hypothetical protein